MRRQYFVAAALIGALLAIALPCAVAPARAQGVESPPTRSIRIATTEVTDPDVAVSADGGWLVFTALGHLFQLPAAGGATRQLTSGPFYDAAPAISPDRTKVAFVSDRKLSSQGNVFILDIASGQIRQVTDEFWVDRPVWSPDGKSLAFLSYQRAGPVGNYWFVGPGMLKSQVRRVELADGKVETLTEPGFVHAVAFLADGRPLWSVVEPETKGKPAMSRLEVLSQQGKVTTALTVEGVVDRIAVDPGDARGLYLRLYKTAAVSAIAPQPEHLAYVTLSDGGPPTVSGLLSRPADWTHDVEDRGAGVRVYVAQLSNPLPRPAFGTAKGAIYLGEKGKLWRIDAATGKRDEITFSADIAFEFYPGSPPPVYSEQRPASPTSILTPRLAPDGASVVFTTAGYLWRQPLAGGAAQRLLDTGGFEWGPAALSPNGKKLAYQLSEGDAQQLRILDLATGQSSTLVSQGRTGRYEPAWSPDGTKLVYTYFEPGPPSYAQKVPSVYLADLVSGKQQKLVDGSPRWQPAAQFSGDGKWVYFTADGQIHRHSTETSGVSQPITALTAFAANGQVSPDGKWIAFRRNDEIWIAPRGTEPVKEEAAFRFSPSGGQQFSFTPDGTALVYSKGTEVWLHPLKKDGRQKQVDIQIKLSTEPPPPVLLRNVRVLDFKTGSFTDVTSLFVAAGRIEWIGAEAGHTLPPDLTAVDGGGRFAIPGLFDMHAHTATPIHLQTARDVSRMEAWIAHGVTSVRDMGSDIATLKAWSDRRTAFGAPVPRIFSYGSMIEEEPFIWGGSVFGASDEQVRDLVRLEKQAGVVGVKSYFTLSWPLHRAVAVEALKQGVPVAAHGLARQEIIRGVLIGHADEEHMVPVNVYYDDLLQLLKATGTHWTPTLSLAFSVIPEGSPLRTGMQAELKRAYQAGVALHAGTDSANPRDNYGQALQAELQNFARAGIPPIEVLRIATQRSAEWVGAGDLLGSLEPGKLADVVLLDANPLDDIANAQTIWRVVAGGRVFAEPHPLPAPDEIEPDEDSTDGRAKD